MLDRGGARKRLEERDAENQRLRAQIERQQRARRSLAVADEQYAGRIQSGDQHDDDHSSSEGTGFYVDIEV